MKRIITLLLVALMLISAVGCGGGGGDTTNSQVTNPEDLKIAMLISGSPTDGGWGQMGANSLEKAKEYFACEGVIVEAKGADVQKTEAIALADEGFHIIVGHGGEFAVPFSEISGDYPDTYFITMGGNIVTENQMNVDFTAEDLTFIMGAIAASITETDTLGMTIGGDFPSYKKTSRGFELGAQSINPDIEVLFAVTQDSSDMNEAYEIAMAQFDQGADVIFTNANQAALGSVKAAKEMDKYVFYGISSPDIFKEAEDLIVATWIQDFSGVVQVIGERYMAGTLEGKAIQFRPGQDEGLEFAWNDKVKDTLSADVVALYDEIYEKIKSGEIDVPNENEGW